MSDAEDFILQIDVETLYPQQISTKKRKAKKPKRSKKKMKLLKLSPSHFIGFQIYDSLIRKNIMEVQEKIIKKNPLLEKALIDVRTLHVTLAVTHIKNKEKAEELQEKLQDWGQKNFQYHFKEPIHLTFCGIGTFRKNVAYIKIAECDNYQRLCNFSGAVNNFLTDSGFYSESSKHFTPHLTLLKLSKNYKFFKDKKDLSSDVEALKECQDNFGSQEVKDIQLLSMRDKKDDNGYYRCLWQMATNCIESTCS